MRKRTAVAAMAMIMAAGCSASATRPATSAAAAPGTARPATAPAASQPGTKLTYELTEPGSMDAAVKFCEQVLSRNAPGAVAKAAGGNRVSVKLPAGSSLSPQDIDKLLLPHGGLEFRIAMRAGALSEEQIRALSMDDSSQHVGNISVRWIRVADGAAPNFDAPQIFITRTTVDGQLWILCDDDPGAVLICDDGAVRASQPYTDRDQVTLPINLDSKAAEKMGALTADHMGHPLIIIYDHHALTGPTINGRITDAGEITLGDTTPSKRHELDLIKASLDAGSLPQMPLRRVP